MYSRFDRVGHWFNGSGYPQLAGVYIQNEIGDNETRKLKNVSLSSLLSGIFLMAVPKSKV